MNDEGLDHEKWRGVEYRLKRMGFGPKESVNVNSPRSSMRKKKSEIRAHQRDAKREDRVVALHSDAGDSSFVIGSQRRRKGSDILTFPTPRPLFCLSASCISNKDVAEATDDAKITVKVNKTKRKQRQKLQKPSRSDLGRSRYIQRLKQVITAGNNGQDRAESDQKVDANQQRYKLRRSELIWLELQAWFNDHSLVDQDQILFNARQSLVMDVLSFISVFHYKPKYIRLITELKARIDSTMQQLPDGACQSCGVSEGFESTEDKQGEWHEEVPAVKNDTESFSRTQLTGCAEPMVEGDSESHPCLSLPSGEYLMAQEHALKTVDQLLKLLCIIENLYPSSNSLAAEYPYYNSTEFQTKIKAVCSWYNITTDLRRKFVSFMRILLLSSSSPERGIDPETYGRALNDDGSNRAEAGFHSSICGIDINQLISSFTNRNLKQRSVKNILHSFLQRMFSGLLRAKMNTMPEKCYDLLEADDRETSSPSVEEKNAIPHLLYSRLAPSVKREQCQALCILIQKVENVLSTAPRQVSKQTMEEIMEDASAISSLDQQYAIFGLPSLKPLYLLLANTIFQIMRQCMHLRMKEAMPFFSCSGSSVSLLTLKQLVLESKEMLECGLLTKDIMYFFMSDFLGEDSPNRILSAFSTYKEDLRSMVNTYLDFAKTWLTRMQRDLPHVPRGFQEILEQEWSFTCNLLPQIDFDSIISCIRHFLEISAEIAVLTREFMTAAVGELVHSQPDKPTDIHLSTTSVEDHSIEPEHKVSPVVGRAGVLWFHRQRSESPHLSRHSSNQSADSYVQPESPVEFGRQASTVTDASLSPVPGIANSSSMPWMTYRSTSYLGYQKRYLFEVCRAVRDLFNETRERAMKILHFGKRLRKTLEPAIGYNFVENAANGLEDGLCCHCHMFDALNCEGYIMVDLSEYIQLRQKINGLNAETSKKFVDLESYWIFIPDPASTLDKFEMVPHENEIEYSSADLLPMIENILYQHLRRTSYRESADQKGEFLQRRIIFIKRTLEHFDFRRQSDVGFQADRKAKARRDKPRSGWRKTKSETNFHARQEDRAIHMRRCVKGGECCFWNGNIVTANVDSDQYSDNIDLLCHQLDLSHDVTVVLESAEDVGIVRKEITSMIAPHARLAIAQMPIVNGIKDVFDSLRQQILQLCSSLIHCIELILNYLDVQSDKILQHGETKNESSDLDLKQKVRSEVNEVMQSCFNFGFDLVKEATRIMSADFHNNISKIHLLLVTQWVNYVLKHRGRGKGYRPRWASQGLAFLVSLDFGYLLKLDEEEFQALKKTIDSFLNHLIGSSARSITTDTPACRESNSSGTLQIPEREVKMLRSLSNSSVAETTPKSPISCEDGASGYDMHGEDDDFTPIERIRYAIESLEYFNDARRFESGAIGRVSDAQKVNSIENLGVRTVSFRWQRGARVGEGAFGKVYTCVNVDTGNILAMKEVKFHPNDHQKIRSAIDEYTNFEGIQHSNLVRYYGVELHRDEMYIFMEYCDGGTLGDICKISLPEEMLRSYTSQILDAIHVLHSRGIVHRDIKGSNIFLTSSGMIKLGDFGSAIKLRDVMKTTPGEMVTHIGTTLPYTAPEVINASVSVGYGRASDIWSLGCVVIEMASGKQPWHDLDRYQLMFKVGSGYRPPIPESLSEEGKNFVSACTMPNPAARWTAEKLLGHAFAKVSSTDETF